MQPLPQGDRTVQRRNCARKSELLLGSPYKNMLKGKRNRVQHEEKHRRIFSGAKGVFFKPST